MNLRRTFLLAAVLVLALWGGLWIWTTRPPGFPALTTAPVAAAPTLSLEARVAALREELAAERDARLGLEAEVEMLRVLLEQDGGGAPQAPPPGAAAPEPLEGAVANLVGEKLWFDAPALQEQGVSAPETSRLEKLFEESELQLLYLRDRATREGWAATPRFLQETYALRSGLRESAGDETFDWLLYATQRTNRVVVLSVLSNGPASQAGLQAGDVIVRYDGRAVFKGRELQQATTQGEAGRSVAVDVQGLDGSMRHVTVPRGPLGIQLGEQRRPPAASR